MADDALLTIAEIAATFAGLVALASLIRPGDRQGLQLYGMIETSIQSAAFALLPTLFSRGPELTDAVLRPCAVAFLVMMLVSLFRSIRFIAASNTSTPFERPDWALSLSTSLVYIPAFGAPLLLLSPMFSEHSVVLYAIAVTCPLAMAVLILRHLVRGLALG